MEECISYFKNLWNLEEEVIFDNLPHFEPCINEKENVELIKVLDEDEIKRII